MAKPELTAAKNAPAATAGKPALVKNEKPVVEAFVNFTIYGADGKTIVLRSNRGFPITNSEKYPMSLEDKALVELARSNGGTAIIQNVEFRVVIHAEKPASLDTTGIVLKKAA